MSVEIKYTCPLGSECETIVDGKIHRCVWFAEIVGKDPQTDEDIKQSYCAMAILPKLIIENTGKQIRTGSAVESFRNEMKQDNATLGKVMQSLSNIPIATTYIEQKG